MSDGTGEYDGEFVEAQIDRLADCVRFAGEPAEQRLAMEFLVSYLDYLIRRGTPAQLSLEDSFWVPTFIIVSHLLNEKLFRKEMLSWIQQLIDEASADDSQRTALYIGLFEGLFEGETEAELIDWDDEDWAWIVGRLFHFCLRPDRRWVFCRVYEERPIEHFLTDLQCYRQWCIRVGQEVPAFDQPEAVRQWLQDGLD